MMRNFVLALVGLSAIAFLMAVIMNLGAAAGLSFRVSPEGFSRASSNLALIAIALFVVYPTRRRGKNRK